MHLCQTNILIFTFPSTCFTLKGAFCWFWWYNYITLLGANYIKFLYLSNQPTWCTKFLFYNRFISCLYMFRAPCSHHQEVKIPLHSLWYHHTYKFDDTRSCVTQFWPPDDEHMCSKHVEAWNKLIVKQKFSASCWLINSSVALQPGVGLGLLYSTPSSLSIPCCISVFCVRRVFITLRDLL